MGEDAERKKERQGNSLLEALDEEVGADHDVVDLGLGAHNPDDEELSGVTSSSRWLTPGWTIRTRRSLGRPLHGQVLSLEESSAEARRPFPPRLHSAELWAALFYRMTCDKNIRQREKKDKILVHR